MSSVLYTVVRKPIRLAQHGTNLTCTLPTAFGGLCCISQEGAESSRKRHPKQISAFRDFSSDVRKFGNVPASDQRAHQCCLPATVSSTSRRHSLPVLHFFITPINNFKQERRLSYSVGGSRHEWGKEIIPWQQFCWIPAVEESPRRVVSKCESKSSSTSWAPSQPFVSRDTEVYSIEPQAVKFEILCAVILNILPFSYSRLHSGQHGISAIALNMIYMYVHLWRRWKGLGGGGGCMHDLGRKVELQTTYCSITRGEALSRTQTSAMKEVPLLDFECGH